jgi:Na+-translocating ferredoxin:NAD+ oxidoreductase RnfD subunit
MSRITRWNIPLSFLSTLMIFAVSGAMIDASEQMVAVPIGAFAASILAGYVLKSWWTAIFVSGFMFVFGVFVALVANTLEQGDDNDLSAWMDSIIDAAIPVGIYTAVVWAGVSLGRLVGRRRHGRESRD